MDKFDSKHETKYQRLRRTCTEDKNISQETIKDMITLVTYCIENDWLQKNGKILEVGCGNGGNSLILAKERFDVIGIDISPTSIEAANKAAQNEQLNVQFVVGDVLQLPFKDNQFDFVLDANCFNCIIIEDRKPFLNEIHRILKPKGVALFMCKSTTVSRHVVIDGVKGRYLGSPRDIDEEIKEAGFRILRTELEQVEKTGYFNMLNIFAQKRR